MFRPSVSFLWSCCWYLTLFSPSALRAEIPVAQIKGIHVHFREEAQELSPLFGLLDKTKIENHFRFSVSQKGASNPPAVTLLHELFHEVDPVNIAPTELGSYAANYLTPGTLAKIIPLLKESSDKLKKSKKVSRDEKDELIEKIKKTIETDDGFTQLLLAGKTAYAQTLTAINKLEQIPGKSSEETQELQRLKTKAVKLNPAINGGLNVEKSLKKLTRSLVDTLYESHTKKDSGFPTDFVFSALNKFIWDKVQSKQEILTYLQALERESKMKFFRSVLPLPRADEAAKVSMWIEDNFQGSDQISTAVDLQTEHLEKTVYQLLTSGFQGKKGPELLTTGTCTTTRGKFSDCGETSLRNFFNAILFDPQTRTLKIDLLKSLKATPALIRYYETFDNMDKQIAPFNENGELLNPRNAWGEVMAQIPGVRYRIAGLDEIDAGKDNMESVLKGLLGVENLQELSAKLTRAGKNIEIEKMGSNFGKVKMQVEGIAYFWHFQSGHFYLERSKVEAGTEKEFKDLLWDFGYQKNPAAAKKYQALLGLMSADEEMTAEIWKSQLPIDFLFRFNLFDAEEKMTFLLNMIKQRPLPKEFLNIFTNMVKRLSHEGDYKKRLMQAIIEQQVEELYPFVKENFPELTQHLERSDVLLSIAKVKDSTLTSFLIQQFPSTESYAKLDILLEVIKNKNSHLYPLFTRKISEDIGEGNLSLLLEEIAQNQIDGLVDFFLDHFDETQPIFQKYILSHMIENQTVFLPDFFKNKFALLKPKDQSFLMVKMCKISTPVTNALLVKYFPEIKIQNEKVTILKAMAAALDGNFDDFFKEQLSTLNLNQKINVMSTLTASKMPYYKDFFSAVNFNHFPEEINENILKKMVMQKDDFFNQSLKEIFPTLNSSQWMSAMSEVINSKNESLYSQLTKEAFEKLHEMDQGRLLKTIIESENSAFYPFLRENYGQLDLIGSMLVLAEISRKRRTQFYDLLLYDGSRSQIPIQEFRTWILQQARESCQTHSQGNSKLQLKDVLQDLAKTNTQTSSLDAFLQPHLNQNCQLDTLDSVRFPIIEKFLKRDHYQSEIHYLHTILAIIKIGEENNCPIFLERVRKKMAPALLQKMTKLPKELTNGL